MAEGYFDHSERRLSGALDGAAEAVDWPAFGNRLGRRLADVRPRRRSAWDILAVGAHLAAATALFAVAVWLGAAWFRYSAYHPDRSERAPAQAVSRICWPNCPPVCRKRRGSTAGSGDTGKRRIGPQPFAGVPPETGV